MEWNEMKCDRSKAKDSFSGHTLLDIDATVAKPGFKPPISMKAMQNEPWMHR